MKNIIGVTMGDPKGIGPEIVAKSWLAMSETERAQFRIYGDRNAIDAAAQLANGEIDPKAMVITSSTAGHMGSIPDIEAARMALSAINAAVDDIKAGRIKALVTAPVNKHRMQSVHRGFTGHTDYLAQLSRAQDVVMMFFAEGRHDTGSGCSFIKQLCISLVTMHIPLKTVAKAVTKERVVVTISRTYEALCRHFACPEPRIAVLSLNPHAGENGSIGREEEKIIEPAIQAARKRGINCIGPLPADGIFNRLAEFDYDGVVAMYHDQGLLPAKLICQGRCVNITLGLPYIRTSPGHGTAEDIAWLGRADPQNMLATLTLTRRLVGWTIEDSGQQIVR